MFFGSAAFKKYEVGGPGFTRVIDESMTPALRRRKKSLVLGSAKALQSLDPLAEGGFNRTFLVTLRDNFQIVVRIPYPITAPKFYAVASELATLEFLRSSGLPVPSTYGNSPDSDNAAETEYIFMEFLTQLESVMMSLSFPADGSLYFTKDLEKVAMGAGIPMEDGRFCIGPDTRLPLLYWRRSKFDVNQGPYFSAKAAVVAGARKELAYLKKFGQPLLPFWRERRAGYEYQEQSPSAHIENLNLYLLIASSLVPRDPALSRFCIRHPDLQQSNVVVSRSPGSDCQVVGLLDWQHASILPTASITITSTEECNKLHYATFIDSIYALRSRLFQHAGSPWEGETFELKLVLIQATERGNALMGGRMPCPVEFDAEDVREMRKLNEVQATADRFFEMWQNMVGLGEEGWVLTEDYEDTVAFFEKEEEALAGTRSAEQRAKIIDHWP
ncbi:hypothetical protein BKA82DRAFT_33673 [Pisolithus tinctorius]|uniref:Aminoglycoside phosphotransferase domain-containing protein n=1 Tax=Pisolithus tinctorius Marx 270 TaxID=870435 RepID=A0A0C3NK28_PISTI|nr:hypothetical protein BKA82DRAFT_33673 [Pisolithus tinctorius]KIN96020.1 hypothetical protein M404DRAFT_33673 [Pisolithus tinctorius Marx 270]